MARPTDSPPELVVVTERDQANARRAQRLAQAGRLRRLYAGVYTSDLESPLEEVVSRHWLAIVGHLLPGAVLSHRSAFDAGPVDGRLVVTRGRTRRRIELPGLHVDVVPGPGPRQALPGSDAPLGALYLSSVPRRCLENLTHGRGWPERVLPREDLENALSSILGLGGHARMKELLLESAAVSEALGFSAQLARLEKLVSQLLGTNETKQPAPIRISSQPSVRRVDEALQNIPPAGNLAREAVAPRGGFLYQDYRTALEWFSLGNDDALFVEVAEDYTRAKGSEFTATQVKNVSGNISLNAEEARDALSSFVYLQRVNPERNVRYAFLTTASPTVEQKREHRASPDGGIRYWRKVQLGEDVAPLRRALLAMDIDQEVRTFIETRTDEDLRRDLVMKIDWLVGADPLGRLEEELTHKVVEGLGPRGMKPAEAARQVGAVMLQILKAGQRIDRNDRRLDKPKLNALLDDIASITISRKEREHFAIKEAIADNLPKELLDASIEKQIAILRNSRHFVGYDKESAALDLASGVRLGGAYAGASDEIRAKALSWAARMLLDSKPDIARELIDTARSLQPHSESIRFVEALREASVDLDQAMARLGTTGSAEAMTTRYFLQRRNAKAVDPVASAIAWFEASGLALDAFDEDGQGMILSDMLQSEMWQDVQTRAAHVRVNEVRHPQLLMACALIALCRAVPEERRKEILNMPPLWDPMDFPLSATSDGLGARGRAIELFVQLQEVAADLGLEAVRLHALEYLLWLKLAASPDDGQTLEDLEALLNADEGWERWVPIAISVGMPLDITAVRERLQQRHVRFGSHDFNSARALLASLLARQANTTAETWRGLRSQLSDHFTADFLTSMEAQAFVRDSNVAGARAALEQFSEGAEGERSRRQVQMLLARFGGENDLELRRDEFKRTDETFDLEQLIRSLRENRQWLELSKYTRLLFDRAKSIDSAEQHVDAMIRAEQWRDLAEFFDTVPELIEGSTSLAQHYVQVRLSQARWTDVRDAVQSGRLPATSARQFTSHLTVLSFQWQEFNAQIEAALKEPEHYAAEDLLQLATIAATIGRKSESKQITTKATEKAPEDPQALASAYFLATKTMWDDDPAPGQWLASAIELSGEEGPLQKKSLADLIELAPAWRERSDTAWASFQSGEIWLEAYAKWINGQLSHTTIGSAIGNRTEGDARKRAVIPAFSGARIPSAVVPASRCAADATSLMNLAYLGLLERLLDVYGTVMVPHSTGAWLFDEFENVEFHQPRKIEDARKLMMLIAQDKIRVCPQVPAGNGKLSRMVGDELSDLVRHAEVLQSKGESAFVIRTSPIPLVNSLLEKEADLQPHGGVLRSLRCLLGTLDRQGTITQSQKTEALTFVSRVDRGWEGDDDLPVGATLLLDDLTVNYLQHLGLLQTLARSGFKLVVHQKLRTEAEAYEAMTETRQQLRNVLSKVHDFLSAGVRSGRVQVLPVPTDNWGVKDRVPCSVGDLFSLGNELDALIVDDRFFNRYSELTRNDGSKIPVHTTLDVLDHLRAIKAMTDLEWLSHRTELRRSGYALIPLSEEELGAAAETSQVKVNAIIESADLRAIRENIQLVQMRGIVNLPADAAWMTAFSGACNDFLTGTVRSAEETRMSALLQWTLDLADLVGFGESYPGDMSATRIRHIGFGAQLRLVMDSLVWDPSMARPEAVGGVIDELEWTDPQSHAWLIGYAKRMLSDLHGNLKAATDRSPEAKYVPLSLWRSISGLPKSMRSKLVDDEDWLRSLGIPFNPQLKLNIPGDPVFDRDAAWNAVSKASSGDGSSLIEDTEGKKWNIAQGGDGRVFMRVDGADRPLAFPDVEYMATESESRLRHLHQRCAELGIRESSVLELREKLERRALTPREVEQVQSFYEKHPLPLLERLKDELRSETTINALFPGDALYYENTIGAWGGEPDIADFADSHSPELGDFPFDVQLELGLLRSGHSSTVPIALFNEAEVDELRRFIVARASGLDIWSLTGFIEGLLSRPDVLDSFAEELLQALAEFDRVVNRSAERIRLAGSLCKAADDRIRSAMADKPHSPYWRRLAAMAQAAVVERALIDASASIEPFTERMEGLIGPYYWASTIDMQEEPMWAPFLLSERQLQQELVGRVLIAWQKHIAGTPLFEKTGDRFSPILEALSECRDMIHGSLPGPAEGATTLVECPGEMIDGIDGLLNADVSAKAGAWGALAVVGTALLLPTDVLDRLLADIVDSGVAPFAECGENQTQHTLIRLAHLAAASRNEPLSKAIIKLARDLSSIRDYDFPTYACLLVSAIAVAAIRDRSRWRESLLECVGHAAFHCEDRHEAINCMAAIDGFGKADWTLRLPMAKAGAALKSVMSR